MSICHRILITSKEYFADTFSSFFHSRFSSFALLFYYFFFVQFFVDLGNSSAYRDRRTDTRNTHFKSNEGKYVKQAKSGRKRNKRWSNLLRFEFADNKDSFYEHKRKRKRKIKNEVAANKQTNKRTNREKKKKNCVFHAQQCIDWLRQFLSGCSRTFFFIVLVSINIKQ